MKTRILSLLVLCIVMSVPCYAQEVPSIVTRGFDAYKGGTYNEAFAVWLKGSPMEADKTTMMNLKGSFTQVESMYGKYTGHEIVRVVALSRSTLRLYAVVNYENGPLFMLFDCYRATKGWVIPTIRFVTEPDKLLPDDFFRKK